MKKLYLKKRLEILAMNMNGIFENLQDVEYIINYATRINKQPVDMKLNGIVSDTQNLQSRLKSYAKAESWLNTD